ncbi:MAG: nicotinamide mononucleotide transporter [Actinobacteria bacterium]|uniref:Unannotated protein n=1 Tax=freshwater metagenome TaxID=449393 RepID=A0A6J5ZLT3_9ZZZZ|nr:nicotinamide mononucleotide transporter [Actinomycetota bacterium]
MSQLFLSTAFSIASYQVTWLELAAVITSLTGVWLGTTGRNWTWPWWALSSALYCWLFYSWDLYASSATQIIFIVAAIWGWFGWGPKGARPRVGTSTQRVVVGVIGLGCTAALAPWLASIGAAATWPDSFGLIFSLIAQVIMVLQYRESWVVWFVVDAIYTIEYATQGLLFTSLVYAIFTVIAVRGWLNWKDNLNTPTLSNSGN